MSQSAQQNDVVNDVKCSGGQWCQMQQLSQAWPAQQRSHGRLQTECHSALLSKQFQLSGVGDMPIETARANCSLVCGRLAGLLQRAQSLYRQIPDLRQVDSFAPIMYLVQSSLLMTIYDPSYIDRERQMTEVNTQLCVTKLEEVH